MYDTKLDNRIFLLQHTKGLDANMKRMLYLADVAYLQDHNADAEQIITQIEKACKEQGIEIFSLTDDPMYAMMGL